MEGRRNNDYMMPVTRSCDRRYLNSFSVRVSYAASGDDFAHTCEIRERFLIGRR
jgi:hypothetical protein